MIKFLDWKYYFINTILNCDCNNLYSNTRIAIQVRIEQKEDIYLAVLKQEVFKHQVEENL